MSVLTTVILALLIPVVLFGSRRWALLSIACAILYLTQGEAVEIFDFSLFPVRFIELCGIVRVIVRREINFANLNSIDRIFLLLYAYTASVFSIRDTEGLSYQIGMAVDATLSYLAFRGLIVSMDDFKWFLNRLVLLLVPYIAIVMIERFTFQNPFALVGANVYTANFRDGIPRCTGSFRHAILLGSFAASFLPLYMGQVFERDNKYVAKLGVGICLGLVWLSNSGGPLTASIFALIGWGFWFFREKLRLVRYGIVGFLILIAIFMKAPIWALPAKISSITGGSGWHRYYLIDRAIETFNEWWIAGMPIAKTREWFPYTLDTGGADITNQFISFGISAGIVAVILFVLLLIKGFQVIGIELAHVGMDGSDRPDKFVVWGIGVMLLVHISNWLGVTYFDQLKLVWYMHIAVIAMLVDEARSLETTNYLVPSLRTPDSPQAAMQSTLN